MQNFVVKLALVKAEEIRPHEEIDQQHVYEIMRDILNRGVLLKPIVIDEATKVIIDGHHRFHALKRIGLEEIPVAVVNYLSENIIVESWKNSFIPSKEEILEKTRKGLLYPYKTTKHMVILGGEKYHISEVVPLVNYPITLKPQNLI